MKTISKKQLDALFEVAGKTMQNSYSPYSKFPVGAAVLAGSGKIYGGTNIENASLGVTVCAERTAIFAAIAAGERTFKALAVVFKEKIGPASTPCGLCRQVMAEFFKPDMPIYRADLATGKVQHISYKRLKEYYPHPFSPAAFKKPKTSKK